eukprot:744271-Pyramimonas_sp.AAC.1
MCYRRELVELPCDSVLSGPLARLYIERRNPTPPRILGARGKPGAGRREKRGEEEEEGEGGRKGGGEVDEEEKFREALLRFLASLQLR